MQALEDVQRARWRRRRADARELHASRRPARLLPRLLRHRRGRQSRRPAGSQPCPGNRPAGESVTSPGSGRRRRSGRGHAGPRPADSLRPAFRRSRQSAGRPCGPATPPEPAAQRPAPAPRRPPGQSGTRKAAGAAYGAPAAAAREAGVAAVECGGLRQKQRFRGLRAAESPQSRTGRFRPYGRACRWRSGEACRTAHRPCVAGRRALLPRVERARPHLNERGTLAIESDRR